jgi:hypothetical protein
MGAPERSAIVPRSELVVCENNTGHVIRIAAISRVKGNRGKFISKAHFS